MEKKFRFPCGCTPFYLDPRFPGEAVREYCERHAEPGPNERIVPPEELRPNKIRRNPK